MNESILLSTISFFLPKYQLQSPVFIVFSFILETIGVLLLYILFDLLYLHLSRTS